MLQVPEAAVTVMISDSTRTESVVGSPLVGKGVVELTVIVVGEVEIIALVARVVVKASVSEIGRGAVAEILQELVDRLRHRCWPCCRGRAVPVFSGRRGSGGQMKKVLP